jgi:predicted ABC-type ATPase
VSPSHGVSVSSSQPSVVVIGGSNGAGKTTISRAVLAETLRVHEFVNADVIATGLSGFDPDLAAIQAGRIMLTRLRELAASRSDFAFETTMASRTFAPWLSRLAVEGYWVMVVFVWLRSAELSIRRVRARVRKGGHHVPDEVVRRRYYRAIRNFVTLYKPIATAWRVYDNSGPGSPRLIAAAAPRSGAVVYEPEVMRLIEETAHGTDEQAQDDP